MITARWEILPTLVSWAAPEAGLLGAPMASGTVKRQDVTTTVNGVTAPPDDSLFAPTDPITVPPAPDGAPFLILSVDVIGMSDWLLTIAPHGQTPQASDGQRHAIDPVPAILIPASGINTSGSRSREVRAVRPGSSFILQPMRPNL